jgi:hypothetical protein
MNIKLRDVCRSSDAEFEARVLHWPLAITAAARGDCISGAVPGSRYRCEGCCFLVASDCCNLSGDRA